MCVCVGGAARLRHLVRRESAEHMCEYISGALLASKSLLQLADVSDSCFASRSRIRSWTRRLHRHDMHLQLCFSFPSCRETKIRQNADLTGKSFQRPRAWFNSMRADPMGCVDITQAPATTQLQVPLPTPNTRQIRKSRFRTSLRGWKLLLIGRRFSDSLALGLPGMLSLIRVVATVTVPCATACSLRCAGVVWVTAVTTPKAICWKTRAHLQRLGLT